MADPAKTTDMKGDKATGDGEPIINAVPPAPEVDTNDGITHSVYLQAVPQSTAIEKTPALCTAVAKWKSKLSSAQGDLLLLPSDGEQPMLNTPGMVGGKDEAFPLVEPSSPSHHHLNGEANKMVRPSISITEAPQVQRPSSRISGRVSASSMSMLATESGKLLQAVPLATGGPSGQQQDNETVTLRINNHSLLAAIPYMPVSLAYICCLLNIFVPGLGTLMSGFSLFCCKSHPQQTTKKDELISSFCTNVCVAISQLFTIPFLLVGWIWSVTWGFFMITFALEYRNYKRNEEKIIKLKAVTKAFMGR